PLALRTEGVLANPPIPAHDAVAGNQKWDRVARNGRSDRTDGRRAPDLAGDPGVGARLTGGNLEHFLENRALELGETAEVVAAMRGRQQSLTARGLLGGRTNRGAEPGAVGTREPV